MATPPGFDPRSAPVLGVDGALPALSPQQLSAQALRNRFKNPPAWTPEIVQERALGDRAPAHAAVLIAVVLHDEPTVLLTERTAHLSTHSGQIAFPGGRTDDTDADASATALREAWEEVGLDARHVEVLGNMPSYRTGTSFIVTPVVALAHPPFALQPSPFEVADVFEAPLAFLMNPAHHRHHAFEDGAGRRAWLSMPYRGPDGVERFIWGATAGMLRNLYRFLSA